jgi:hypothetical protein
MTDRPILFSGPMVRALLDGTKTQTRRVLKPQPLQWQAAVIDILPPTQDGSGNWGQVETVWSGAGMCEPDHEVWHPIRHHRVGDRLWVRETWAFDVNAIGSMRDEEGPFVYAADPSGARTRLCERWTPSIHMPRWASRLTLIVTDVRVQRLQEISDTDAMAEGLTPVRSPINGHVTYQVPNLLGGQTPQRAFKVLWDTINGPGAWDANPWVVATTFTVHRCNIDQMEARR